MPAALFDQGTQSRELPSLASTFSRNDSKVRHPAIPTAARRTKHARVLHAVGARRIAGVCLLAWWLALGGLSPAAWAWQGDGFINREYPLKALFLYNFGGYVEWPAEAFGNEQQPFVIGVLGSAPIDAMLHEIAASKAIAGRRIEIQKYASPETIGPCHILFVARNVSTQQARAAIERLRGLPVLTVGDSPGFAKQGGCVNFYIESNKIRFEVNLEAAKQQHLRISAKLLALARIVE